MALYHRPEMKASLLPDGTDKYPSASSNPAKFELTLVTSGRFRFVSSKKPVDHGL